MISKEVLAKANEVMALALTKHKISLKLMGFDSGRIFLSIGQAQEKGLVIYHHGGDHYFNSWIFLTESNALDQLEQALQWLHTR